MCRAHSTLVAHELSRLSIDIAVLTEKQPKNNVDALSIQILADRQLNPPFGRETELRRGDILKKETSSFRTATVKDNFQSNLQTKLHRSADLWFCLIRTLICFNKTSGHQEQLVYQPSTKRFRDYRGIYKELEVVYGPTH
ncbi:unnamed protein product [Brugia pahangi]|uniref:Transposase n=1 Tax=Brugia pahangi TaxID=6280 RepID=A0A0N4TU41_BRUPA|nr:unnamed protein product [Brugia pahangi]